MSDLQSDEGSPGTPLSVEGDVLATIRVDLESRFRSGDRPTVESYFTQYPQITTSRSLMIALIETEYRLRLRFTGEDDTQEYQRRFSEYWAEVSTRLLANGGSIVDDVPVIRGYEVGELLGRGGFGRVYRALQLSVNRPVAIKVLRIDDAANPQVNQRFIAEATLLAMLSHPHIVQVYEAGMSGDGRPYISMELIAGGNLRQRMQREQISIQDSAAIVKRLAETVAHAHQHGIIHRDLKPENVLCTPDGAPKIVDFGLAKYSESSMRLTQTGDVLGTLLYAAPEQIMGRTGEVDARSDVYSLGVILYELLSGRRPFEADHIAGLLVKFRAELPPPLPRVPRDLATICLKCLEVKPQDRYANAGELAADLDRYLNQSRIQGRRPSLVARIRGYLTRQPRRAMVLAAALVAALITLTGLAYYAAFQMPVVEYYESFMDRRWAPQGLKSVAVNHVSERFQTTRFLRQGYWGQVLEVAIVDSQDGLNPNNNLVPWIDGLFDELPRPRRVCRLTIGYDPQGAVREIAGYDQFGKNCWRFGIDTQSPRIDVVRYTKGGYPPRKEGPTMCDVEFDELDRPHRLVLKDNHGTMVPDRHGAFGYEYEWCSAGLVNRRSLGPDGKETANRKHWSRLMYRYNNDGRAESVHQFNGQVPVATAEQGSECLVWYDPFGNNIKTLNRHQGQPWVITMNSDRFACETYELREGRVVGLTQFLDDEQTRIRRLDRFETDNPEKYCLECTFFDAKNECAEKQRWTCDRYGLPERIEHLQCDGTIKGFHIENYYDDFVLKEVRFVSRNTSITPNVRRTLYHSPEFTEDIFCTSTLEPCQRPQGYHTTRVFRSPAGGVFRMEFHGFKPEVGFDTVKLEFEGNARLKSVGYFLEGQGPLAVEMVITEVIEGLQAAKAGIQSDDLMVSYNGEPVLPFELHLERRRSVPPASIVPIVVRRGNQALPPILVTSEKPLGIRWKPRLSTNAARIQDPASKIPR
jgi:hypothetical protein